MFVCEAVGLVIKVVPGELIHAKLQNGGRGAIALWSGSQREERETTEATSLILATRTIDFLFTNTYSAKWSARLL